jgi:hypothetical protein
MIVLLIKINNHKIIWIDYFSADLAFSASATDSTISIFGTNRGFAANSDPTEGESLGGYTQKCAAELLRPARSDRGRIGRICRVQMRSRVAEIS